MKRSISIPAVLSGLSALRDAISDFIGIALDETDKGRVILAVDEAVTNVIAHGYHYDESKSIVVEMESSPDSFTFIIIDTAEEFNPLEVAVPDITEYHEQGGSGGLGVDLYRRIMDVRYERIESGGNRLILIKERANENK